MKSKLKALNERRLRFGAVKTIKHTIFRFVNKFIYFDCFYIVILSRENMRPLCLDKPHRFSTKIATLDDLKEMKRQGCWEIQKEKLDFFSQGDTCFLSYIDNTLAGYTWVHTMGCPELVPGLRLSIPQEYVYNFAAFTLPKYRGYGLQSFRHHAVLSHHNWRDKKGLLGYVVHTNCSSIKGQTKSGFVKIGGIWLIGGKNRFIVFIDKNLRRMGIRRIHSSSSATKECILNEGAF